LCTGEESERLALGKTQQLGKCLPSPAVFLGANNQTVGTNNLGTTFSGLIQDGGSGGEGAYT